MPLVVNTTTNFHKLHKIGFAGDFVGIAADFFYLDDIHGDFVATFNKFSSNVLRRVADVFISTRA